MLHFLAGGGGLLSFNTGFGIWVAISTLVFLFLMNKYLVPPIMKALNERETRIKDSLESAEKALAKAEQVSKDNEKALREAEQKAQKIRKQALEDAELMRSEKIEKAKEEAEKILENARTTIEQEKQKALVELRNEVSELAINAASMIMKSELDQAKNKKLVDSFINDLSKQN
ncbi:F0F1 ATP synthase subunit B [Rhodohalobacter mucosus]|uniref:ATP synthase subunit b n=1 Tax=Rhodohalobacter mucosus TaxID=2079485 RepID=A0A316TRD3_9BACT|nr:F0F1 ATP synthase subunit B [Rhodohalobacter mucosus]PWN06251.1 ATP synthase F0 subunit B [Rhodohalobacter mucosus]